MAAASMVFAVLLVAGPHAAPKELSFAPLLEEGAEWVYAPYSEELDGTRTDLAAPGELHLKVALVRQVGKTTLVALMVLVDGVDALKLRSDVNFDETTSASAFVLAISKSGLRALGMELEDARTATDEQIAAATTTSGDAIVFPARPKKGELVRWKLDDAQQTGEAKATLTRTQEQVDGRPVEAWATRWKGKACFAGECTPFAGTQAYAPELGLLRLCRIAMYGKSSLACLRMVGRAARSIPEPVPDAPPTLGDIWRTMQSAKPAVLACMSLPSSISEITFQIEPDGSLSGVKELNQSGPAAQCTVKAVAGVHFPPFKGKPVVMERISFAH